MAERCPHEFPLPWWMGRDQDHPCRCDLDVGHDGPHSAHIEAGGQVRLWVWLHQVERTIDRTLARRIFRAADPSTPQPGLRLVTQEDTDD